MSSFGCSASPGTSEAGQFGNGSDEVLAHAFVALLKQSKPLLQAVRCPDTRHRHGLQARTAMPLR